MAFTDALKVVVLGGSSVGKTSLLNRFASDTFDEIGQAATVGGAFFAKSVMVGSEKVNLHLWDTAGCETFRSITRMYYRNARAAIVCYDVGNYSSFVSLTHWTKELMENEPKCPIYICGCKLDLPRDRRQVPLAEARQFAEGKGAAALFETSALTGENVVALFNKISGDLVEWNFVSIITGNRRQQQPAVNTKSFMLNNMSRTSADELGKSGGHSCLHQCNNS